MNLARDEFVKRELETLVREHEDLNQIIDESSNHDGLDQLTLQRLKKRKLYLKDKISQLKTILYPDIIA
jgi:hypothetical protein